MFMSALYRAIGRVSIWTVVAVFFLYQSYVIWGHFNG